VAVGVGVFDGLGVAVWVDVAVGVDEGVLVAVNVGVHNAATAVFAVAVKVVCVSALGLHAVINKRVKVSKNLDFIFFFPFLF